MLLSRNYRCGYGWKRDSGGGLAGPCHSSSLGALIPGPLVLQNVVPRHLVISKTYLRATMTETGHNHLGFLSSNRDIADSLELCCRG